ncbi:MAG: hypothetical protein HYS22_08930 [Deltaproteobacteria bacterium]|nr:hypothetical protein [Deltaproteobacteria bacterium]
MIGWFKNVVNHLLPGVISQGAGEIDERGKAPLIDVAEGTYLAEKAREKGAMLLGIIQRGGTEMARLQLAYKAKKQVRRHISPAFDTPEIVDEVTERIVDAALADPHYKTLFD